MGWKWQQKNSNDDRVSADISSYIKALYTGNGAKILTWSWPTCIPKNKIYSPSPSPFLSVFCEKTYKLLNKNKIFSCIIFQFLCTNLKKI